jgi:hypothetical protein
LVHEPWIVLPSVAGVVANVFHTAVPLAAPSTQALVVTVPGAAAGPKVWVKAAQHDPTAQVVSLTQAVLLAVRVAQALLLIVLAQFHWLITPLTLNGTPLNQTGAQTEAGAVTKTPALESLAQQ